MLQKDYLCTMYVHMIQYIIVTYILNIGQHIYLLYIH